jgi:hypothetical protein
MKKQARTLIILGVVLVVCIGAYIGVTVYNTVQAQKAAEAAKAPQLWGDGRGAPVTISYTTGDKTLSFKQEGGSWTVADNKDFPLNQTSLTGLASSLQSLAAVRTIDIAAPLATYGLDAPAYTLTASDSGGNSLTLLIGAENGGNYYAMTKDGNKVYTISSAIVGNMKPDLLGMISLDKIHSVTSSNTDTITVTSGSASLQLDKHLNKDNTTTWFIVRGDTFTAADEFVPAVPSEKTPVKLIEGAVSGLSSFRFSSCAAYQPTADALKTFGLDVPQLTVKIDYTDVTGQGTLEQKSTKGSVSLELGVQLADGSGYYARLPGSNQVNVLPLGAVTPLLDALAALGG